MKVGRVHKRFAEMMQEFEAGVAKQRADLKKFNQDMREVFGDGPQWNEAQIEAIMRQERRK